MATTTGGDYNGQRLQRIATVMDGDYDGWQLRHQWRCRVICVCKLYNDGVQKRRKKCFSSTSCFYYYYYSLLLLLLPELLQWLFTT
jgi:hypothetical protein